MNFSTYISNRRRTLGITLRDFCEKNAFDAESYSRIERGIDLPKDVKKIASALEIELGSKEAHLLGILADIASKNPPAIINVADKLPLINCRW